MAKARRSSSRKTKHSRKTHRRMHRKRSTRRRSTRRRGGADALSGAPVNYHLSGDWSSRMSLGQGADYFKYHEGQHGGGLGMGGSLIGGDKPGTKGTSFLGKMLGFGGKIGTSATNPMYVYVVNSCCEGGGSGGGGVEDRSEEHTSELQSH